MHILEFQEQIGEKIEGIDLKDVERGWLRFRAYPWPGG